MAVLRAQKRGKQEDIFVSEYVSSIFDQILTKNQENRDQNV
jgi:hypothetical protein